jgi:cellulose synthase/poly-beta-1,6-N-acetylglucosamine synthase-like glycosyltransferase
MRISIVIPVYNGGAKFGRCLTALGQSDYPDWECIVVDDGSTDNSPELARKFGTILLCTERPQSGPAAARNLGVSVTDGDVLFFIDSDVLIKPETLTQVAKLMSYPNAPAACIGSYDDQPTEPNFLSQYRNLLHHFTHQKSNQEAATFWGACGAIDRHLFHSMGGFNNSYTRPSIEDIELGYRISAKGHRITLAKHIQVSHMKRWTAVNMLQTDIRDRAIPWARLIINQETVLDDLNLTSSQRVSSAASLVGTLALAVSFFLPWTAVLAGLMGLLLIVLNYPFYQFLIKKRGLIFLLMVLPWHWLYFVYSGLTFGFCYVFYGVQKRKN